jgi:hypothetical protein
LEEMVKFGHWPEITMSPLVPSSQYPICPSCSLPVVIENSKTDEKGRAVHEECYVLKIRGMLKKPTANS